MKTRNILGMAAAAVFALSVILVQAQTATSTYLISPTDAKKMIDEGKFELVLDVRTVDEYTGPLGHIKGSRLLPIQNLEAGMKAIEKFKDKTVLVYCHSGGRSAKSARILQENGFTKVYDLDGGITSWKTKGLPTENQASQN